MTTKQKLYAIDALNWIFRAYYAIAPMTNEQGQSTHAVFGFIRTLLKFLRDFGPDNLVVVIDGPDNKQKREALYSEYKSHRKESPQDLYPQIDLSEEFCKLYGISTLRIPGVEADDTIGAIAKHFKDKFEIIICSSDKDLCQLVEDGVSLLNPFKENLKLDSDGVFGQFGIHPHQMVDYLSIVGDASDNIPGVEGVGPKGASELLSKYKSLQGIYHHIDELTPKKKELFLKCKEMSAISQKLATIDTEVEIPLEPSFYTIKSREMPALEEFLKRMRFMTLLKELSPEASASSSTLEPSSTQITSSLQFSIVLSLEDLEKCKKALEKEEWIAFDCETTSLEQQTCQVVGVGLGSLGKECFYIPLNGTVPKETIFSFLETLFSNPKKKWICHNGKYDLHALRNQKLPVPKIEFDTMIASYLLSPHQTKHNLDDLAQLLLSYRKIPIESLIGKGKAQITMLEVPIEQVGHYCAEDVWVTLLLYDIFQAKLKEDQKLYELFTKIEIPLLHVLFEMENAGIYVDPILLTKVAEQLAIELQQLQEKIYAFVGEPFNIHSPKQLSVILFEKLQLPVVKKTSTGYSTNAEVLEELEDKSPLIPLVLRYRVLEKLRSTYAESLLLDINPKTHRIHCTFQQSVAATGRLSCQNPNLQNIPVRSAEGRKIRSAFCAEGTQVLLGIDYSQIELRLLAHFSEDPQLVSVFSQNEDIHSFTASLIFGVPTKEVTSEMRQAAKTVNFGIVYGQSAFGLSKELKISVQEASRFITNYFDRYPGVRSYLEESKAAARKNGYAETLLGRKRPLPELTSSNGMLRSAAERLAINTPLQGTQADLIKLAMLSIDRFLRDGGYKTRMLLQIHDELLFEGQQDEIEKISTKIKSLMENVAVLKVPLIADISIGKNWSEC